MAAFRIVAISRMASVISLTAGVCSARRANRLLGRSVTPVMPAKGQTSYESTLTTYEQRLRNRTTWCAAAKFTLRATKRHVCDCPRSRPYTTERRQRYTLKSLLERQLPEPPMALIFFEPVGHEGRGRVHSLGASGTRSSIKGLISRCGRCGSPMLRLFAR